MADQTIRTVKLNLIKLKEIVVNILHISKMVLRFLRATYEREQIKKLTIWLQVISEYSLMVQ